MARPAYSVQVRWVCSRSSFQVTGLTVPVHFAEKLSPGFPPTQVGFVTSVASVGVPA